MFYCPGVHSRETFLCTKPQKFRYDTIIVSRSIPHTVPTYAWWISKKPFCVEAWEIQIWHNCLKVNTQFCTYLYFNRSPRNLSPNGYTITKQYIILYYDIVCNVCSIILLYMYVRIQYCMHTVCMHTVCITYTYIVCLYTWGMFCPFTPVKGCWQLSALGRLRPILSCGRTSSILCWAHWR